MLKNQSIKSFFTSKNSNETKKKETEKSEEEIIEVTNEKQDTKTKKGKLDEKEKDDENKETNDKTTKSSSSTESKRQRKSSQSSSPVDSTKASLKQSSKLNNSNLSSKTNNNNNKSKSKTDEDEKSEIVELKDDDNDNDIKLEEKENKNISKTTSKKSDLFVKSSDSPKQNNTNKKKETTTTTTKTPKTESSSSNTNKRQRKNSNKSPVNSPKTTSVKQIASKLSKTNLAKDKSNKSQKEDDECETIEDDDEVLFDDEKDTSSKLSSRLHLSESDTDSESSNLKSTKTSKSNTKETKLESDEESPIKNVPNKKNGKKRKLVVESDDSASAKASDTEIEKKNKKENASKKVDSKQKASKSKVSSDDDEVKMESETTSEKDEKKSPVVKPKKKLEKNKKKKESTSENDESENESKKTSNKTKPKKSPSKSPERKKSPIKSPKEKLLSPSVSIIKSSVDETTKKENKISSFFTKMKEASSSASASTSSKDEKTGAVKIDYSPHKENYHPIDDACWVKDQPVPYKALAQTLNSMEQTTKRLELLSIVCNYFRSVLALTPNDLVASMYLLTNKVAPDYDSLELGIGDTILFKALGEATGATLQKIKVEFQNKGDIGLVAESHRCNQKLIFTPKKLTVNHVFTKLKEIASISGSSSQSKKCDIIKALLVSCDSIEARYLMRSLSGKLRCGLAEQSILQALAHACATTPPPNKSKPDEKLIIDKFEKMRKNNRIDEIKEELEKTAKLIKHAYHQCPNYQLVVNAILEYGLENLNEHCKLTPGVPLKPMLAYPTKGIQEVLQRFDNIEFTCEYKYDGERAQIHILDNGEIQIYSRNSENNTGKYPDIIESLKEILKLKSRKNTKQEEEEESDVVEVEEVDKETYKVKSAILDAEVVAYDTENNVILPFQVLSTRKRKDASVSDIKIQVCIFAFDLLYLNGESLIDQPFRKRRDYLYKYFPKTTAKLMFAEKMDSNNLDSIQEFLDKSVKDGCEGLMVKTLDSEAHYEISKRSHNWLKLKKDYLEGVGDTLDLVVIGGYLGTGKRTGIYGGYLLACYDAENEEYQTICKIGTGFKDDDLEKNFQSLSKIKIDKPKSYYRINDSLEQPDHWFEAEQVWEVKCADFSISPVHTAASGLVDSSKGISLRFPRFLKLREDKKPEQATSSEQVVEMYKNQQQMLNQNDKLKSKKPAGSEDEEED